MLKPWFQRTIAKSIPQVMSMRAFVLTSWISIAATALAVPLRVSWLLWSLTLALGALSLLQSGLSYWGWRDVEFSQDQIEAWSEILRGGKKESSGDLELDPLGPQQAFCQIESAT